MPKTKAKSLAKTKAKAKSKAKSKAKAKAKPKATPKVAGTDAEIEEKNGSAGALRKRKKIGKPNNGTKRKA